MQAVSDVVHLSCGAMFGVLVRVGLGRAFGPTALGVVSSTSPLFLDLPANVFGCLLAGFFSPFKTKAAQIYRGLPLFIATGCLGSVTSTFKPLGSSEIRPMYCNGHAQRRCESTMGTL